MIQPVDSVPCDEYIDEAVVVVISPYGTFGASAPRDDRAYVPGRHFGEGAVAVVPEELILGGEAVGIGAGDKKVQIAVVVIIHPRATAPVPGFAANDAVGELREGPVTVVVKQKVFLRLVVKDIIRTRDQKIEEPIVIVVPPGASRPGSQIGDDAARCDLCEGGIDVQMRDVTGDGPGAVGHHNVVISSVGYLDIC